MINDPAMPQFSVNQLEMREITAPADAALLKKLVEKEGVHPIEAEDLLKKRMTPESIDEGHVWDKHCYGLFAPGDALPQAAVYVKFMKRADGNTYVPNHRMTGNINVILGEKGKPIEGANTAIFYSITNMASPNVKSQPGEHSIGESLINKVAAELQQQHHIHNFITLSPMRQGKGVEAKGFCQWLKGQLTALNPILTPDEQEKLQAVRQHLPACEHASLYGSMLYMHEHFEQMNDTDQKFFSQLMRDLGIQYLVEAKSEKSDKRAFDPVEQFHLSNGASLAKIHYQPPSKTTLSETAGALGLMVNYRYVPEAMPENKRRYMETGEIRMDSDLKQRHLSRMKHVTAPSHQVSDCHGFGQFMAQVQHDGAKEVVARRK